MDNETNKWNISVPDFYHHNRRQEELAGRNDAENIFKYLVTSVELFEAKLNDDEEIGVKLANFGEASQIHIRHISFNNPNLIVFFGIDQNQHEVTLIQHISQLNFLLIAVKPIAEKPYRVGFTH